jgi:hypothetical protein
MSALRYEGELPLRHPGPESLRPALYSHGERRIIVCVAPSLLELCAGLNPEAPDFSTSPGKVWTSPWAWGADGWKGTWTASREALLADLRAGKASDAQRAALQQAREILQPTVERIIGVTESIRRRRSWSVEGDEPDADRVLGGDPNVWSRMRPGKPLRTVRLGVLLHRSYVEPADSFVLQMARAVAAVEVLERTGYVVELLGVFAIDAHGRFPGGATDVLAYCPLKRPEEAADVEALLTAGDVRVSRGSVLAGECHYLGGEKDLGRAVLTEPIQHYLGPMQWIDARTELEKVVDGK